MFAQGSFNIDQNSTPEQIAQKRALIARLMPQFGRARYVGEGLGQLATGVAIGRANKRLGEVEGQKRAEISSLFDSIMGGARGSAEGFSVLGNGTPGGTWTPQAPGPKATDTPGMGMTPLAFPKPNVMSPEEMRAAGLEVAPGGAQVASMNAPPPGPAPLPGGPQLDFGSAVMTPQEMLIEGAKKRGLNPIDVATAISYETGGKFDPTIKGPTTQWGTHEGLIQFGDPQGQQHGAVFDKGPEMAMRSQLDPENGAVWSYLQDTGVQPGMGLPEIYSAINAGAVGRMGASDANNGGAPGTVADKVAGMGPHREKAAAFLGGTWTPNEGAQVAQSDNGIRNDAGLNAGGFDLGTLAEIANSPYATEGQRAVAGQLLQQQMQAADPMYRLGVEKAQLELAQMRDGGGGSEEPAGYRELALRAEAAGLQPGTPEFQQFMLSGGGGIREGRPAAFEALHQQALAAGLQEGSDAYRQFMLTKGAGEAARAKEIGTTSGTAAAELAGATAMLGTIDTQISDLLADPYLPRMLGSVDSRLPNVSSDAARVQSRIDQLGGGAFLQARQMLKGGGAITDFESQRAEQAFARLQTAQSPEDFATALQEFRAIVAQGVKKLETQAQMGGQAAPTQGGGQVLTFNPETGELE